MKILKRIITILAVCVITGCAHPVVIAPDIEIKKIWDFTLLGGNAFIDRNDFMNDEQLTELAKNDGLSLKDFVDWFENFSYHFEGQILCWNENIDY